MGVYDTFKKGYQQGQADDTLAQSVVDANKRGASEMELYNIISSAYKNGAMDDALAQSIVAVKPNVEVPVEEGVTAKDYATAIFPRSMKSIEEGRDVVAPVDIEKGELGSFLPFISNEQLASVSVMLHL